MNHPPLDNHWSAFELRDPTTTITHKAYDEAMAKLKRIMATSDDTWLAQLVASTGCGKTHVATVLHGEVLAAHAEEMKSDTTIMPSVYVSMSLLTDKAVHNWADDYFKILEGLKHPNPRSRDLSEAREKLRKTLAARKTKQLILDEAAHFIYGCDPGDADALKRRANVVKSLTEDTQTRLLLCATYDLVPMIRIDGQLARRNQVVHLRRYRNTPEDLADFADILARIDQTFPEHLGVSLEELSEYMYRGCVGLVGTLRNWLVRASTSAEQNGRRHIAKEDLDENKLTLGELTPILEQALNGEERLVDTKADHDHFDKLLGQDQVKDSSPPSLGTEPGDNPAPPHKPRKKRRQPGRPNPRRIRTDDPDGESS